MSLRLFLLPFFLSLLATFGHGAGLVVESLSRIEEPGKILELIGSTRSFDGQHLYIAVAESEAEQDLPGHNDQSKGLVAYSLHEIDSASGRTTELFRTTLAADDGKLGFSPHRLRCLGITADGEFLLSGCFKRGFSTIRKMNHDGKLILEIPHPNEFFARRMSPVIHEMIGNGHDAFLATGYETFLYGADLRQKWKLPDTFNGSRRGFYDAKRNRFVLERALDNRTKFGSPTDDPRTTIIAVDEAGNANDKAVLAGMCSGLTPSGDRMIVLLDTLQKVQRFKVSILDTDFKEINSHSIADVPEPFIPSVYPQGLRLVALPNGHVRAIANPKATLFAREWDENGKLVVGESLWSTAVGGEMFMETKGDAALIVTAEQEMRFEGDQKSPTFIHKEWIRIDRLTFAPAATPSSLPPRP